MVLVSGDRFAVLCWLVLVSQARKSNFPSKKGQSKWEGMNRRGPHVSIKMSDLTDVTSLWFLDSSLKLPLY